MSKLWVSMFLYRNADKSIWHEFVYKYTYTPKSVYIAYITGTQHDVCAGAVKRVGRCDAYATEFDLEAEEYVPLPKVSDIIFLYVSMQPFVLCMLGLLAHL